MRQTRRPLPAKAPVMRSDTAPPRASRSHDPRSPDPRSHDHDHGHEHDSDRGLVVVASAAPVSGIESIRTGFVSKLGSSLALVPAPRAPARSIGDARAHALADLYAIAQIAHDYLFAGGTRIAITLFEGLTALAPREPYFALALGLAHDHAGDRSAAHAAYRRAGELDPGDARADLNRAELHLGAGDHARALPLLRTAHHKACARKDSALEKKASSLLHHVQRRRAQAGSLSSAPQGANVSRGTGRPAPNRNEASRS